MKRALFTSSLLALVACGGPHGDGSGIAEGGTGTTTPFTDPFTPKTTATPYQYLQPWYAQDTRPAECASDLVVRARHCLQTNCDLAGPSPVPGSALGDMFDNSTVWFYEGDGKTQAIAFSKVLNETATDWDGLGNFELEEISSEGRHGHLEVEHYGRSLVHELLHLYEVRTQGKSLSDTMKHNGWAANGFDALSSAFSAQVDPQTGVPCYPAGPGGGTTVP